MSTIYVEVDRLILDIRKPFMDKFNIDFDQDYNHSFSLINDEFPEIYAHSTLGAGARRFLERLKSFKVKFVSSIPQAGIDPRAFEDKRHSMYQLLGIREPIIYLGLQSDLKALVINHELTTGPVPLLVTKFINSANLWRSYTGPVAFLSGMGVEENGYILIEALDQYHTRIRLHDLSVVKAKTKV